MVAHKLSHTECFSFLLCRTPTINASARDTQPMQGPRNGGAEGAAASPLFGAKRKINQKKILRKKIGKIFSEDKNSENKVV